MERKIRIEDKSGDRKYFTIIPNYIANHSTANDQALYFQMKRKAGEDGKCFATQKTLMRSLGIGEKALKKSLNYLIKNNWVTFIGLTDGKTRPIKTYVINDIWKLNQEYYEKISSESILSSKKDKSQKEVDKSQKKIKISSESSIEEEPIKEEPEEDIATPSVVADSSGLKVNEMIDYLFKEISPTYQRLYSNITQRKAMETLLKSIGEDSLRKWKEPLKYLHGRAFAPVITTPLQLLNKMSEGISFLKKERDKENGRKIKSITI